jgi:hypothetical protein
MCAGSDEIHHLGTKFHIGDVAARARAKLRYVARVAEQEKVGAWLGARLFVAATPDGANRDAGRQHKPCPTHDRSLRHVMISARRAAGR